MKRLVYEYRHEKSTLNFEISSHAAVGFFISLRITSTHLRKIPKSGHVSKLIRNHCNILSNSRGHSDYVTVLNYNSVLDIQVGFSCRESM